MNEITINRIYGENGTYGTLIAKRDNKIVLVSNTIELPWKDNQHNISCIPEGKYKTKPYVSKHLGLVYEVLNVPDRSAILIHKGNFVAGKKIDLRGCIAPVSYIKDINGDTYLDGAHSGEILKILFSLFPNGFNLIIKKSKDE